MSRVKRASTGNKRKLRRLSVRASTTWKIANRIYSYLGHTGISPQTLVDEYDISRNFDLPVPEFRARYLASEMMSKYDSFDLGVDRKAVAIEAFRAAEVACGNTNIRLQTPCKIWNVEAVISTARSIIHDVLGEFDIDELFSSSSFSGGASTSKARHRAHASYKMKPDPEDKPHITPRALPYYETFRKSSLHMLVDPAFASSSLRLVPGSRITTVKKNAKTERVIAIEPCWNMFFQKGLGAMIRRRLRKVGIDLNDQSLNQALALIGSIYDTLATIDLKAASDTVAMELVRLLLPASWVYHIDNLRSHYGDLDGELIKWEKVSSMGNGFTFELESLIFYALVAACRKLYAPKERRLSVYGDDIICSSELVKPLSSVFEYCGFTMNVKKTWTEGPFRESCGKHYYRGCDVTPFYIRTPINSVPRLFWLLNKFRTWVSTPTGIASRDSLELWTWILSIVPRRWRLFGPSAEHDYWIHSGLDQYRRCIRRGFIGLLPVSEEKPIYMYTAYILDLFSRLDSSEELGLETKYSSSIPDRFVVQRIRSVVGWHDDNPFVMDFGGPVGLV